MSGMAECVSVTGVGTGPVLVARTQAGVGRVAGASRPNDGQSCASRLEPYDGWEQGDSSLVRLMGGLSRGVERDAP